MKQRQPKVQVTRASAFTCPEKRKTMTLGDCLDGFMNANLFRRETQDKCCRCPRGSAVRQEYAESGAAEPLDIDDWR